MSEFFRSDVVRETVVELSQMQERLMMEMPQLPYLPPDKKKEHLKFLKSFLEKQKLFFFRMSLVEDEEVKMIKEKLIEAAKMFGYNEIDGMDKFFERLDLTISELDSKIDN